jgi:hypothetical protein
MLHLTDGKGCARNAAAATECTRSVSTAAEHGVNISYVMAAEPVDAAAGEARCRADQ